jgi:TonB family protein
MWLLLASAAATAIILAPQPQPEPMVETFHVEAEDYPPLSRSRGEQGVSRIAVRVGADGRVSECAVIDSSRYRDLDIRACQLALCRWRFAPAMAAGVPVESVAVRAFRWQTTDAEGRPQAGEVPPPTAPAGPGPMFRLADDRRAAACGPIGPPATP